MTWKVLKDPAGSISLKVREGWQMQLGESNAVRFLQIVPAAPGQQVLHEMTLLLLPILTSQWDLTIEQRVAVGLSDVDALFPGLARNNVSYLDAPGGQMARVDYRGMLRGQFPAVGMCAATRRKMYMVACTLISVQQAAGQLDGDALEMLNSVEIHVPERNQAAEQALVGQWIVPSKDGSRWETYTFAPGNTYAYRFESSHAGALRNQVGDTTANWGTASQDAEQGSYLVRDDLIYFAPAGGRPERIVPSKMWQDGGKVHLRIGPTTFVR
jgi:hypothetical protein